MSSLWSGQERVYFPQMCSKNTQAMNSRLITRTGTGPLQGEQNQDKLTDTEHTEATKLHPVCCTRHNGSRTHSRFGCVL